MTAKQQRLQSVDRDLQVHGIGHIAIIEARGYVRRGLSEHEHLKTCWPYDEVESLTTKVLQDQHIDDDEHRLLKSFFTEFTVVLDERTIVSPLIATAGQEFTIGALCAVAPNVTFKGSAFCFTGASSRYRRSHFEQTVAQLGGRTLAAVSPNLNFLVIGAEGNPCWTCACYGRKVEKAVELRKKGANIVILHEHDFHDAVLDA